MVSRTRKVIDAPVFAVQVAPSSSTKVEPSAMVAALSVPAPTSVMYLPLSLLLRPLTVAIAAATDVPFGIVYVLLPAVIATSVASALIAVAAVTAGLPV